jgi:hypothetical protein
LQAQGEEELYLNVVIALDLLLSGGLAMAHWDAICGDIEPLRQHPQLQQTPFVSPQPLATASPPC